MIRINLLPEEYRRSERTSPKIFAATLVGVIVVCSVERIVSTIFDEIVDALARGDRVELRGFGAFSIKRRSGAILGRGVQIYRYLMKLPLAGRNAAPRYLP